MSEWQPIETAPRDGTPLIIIAADSEEPIAFVAHWAVHPSWNENEPAWLIGAKWARYNRLTPALSRAYAELVGIICEPTHWMPLPEPPPLNPYSC